MLPAAGVERRAFFRVLGAGLIMSGLGLRGFLASGPARAHHSTATEVELAAAWQTGPAFHLGRLRVGPGGDLIRLAQIDLPTRAHGLLHESSGNLLAVARRPGDWLLRWQPPESGTSERPPSWHWIEPGRAFAGHLLASPDGTRLYSTEIDLETGQGLIGVRDGKTLIKQDEWPSHGLDPHEMAWDRTRPGHFFVANGGIPTRPETGRIKHDLDRMASSLVRLDARTGAVRGQWRLEDPRLSLRHLAWNGRRLGIALQAEHDDPGMRQRAPVLAVLEDNTLRPVDAPVLMGYGGSIVGHDDGFAVSCPKAQGVALFGMAGYRGFLPLPDACPLAVHGGTLWAGGGGQVFRPGSHPTLFGQADLRLDNHWLAI